MILGKIYLNSVKVNFASIIQDEIDVYIHRRKYQVKPHSFSWFSSACATAIVHRNHIFLRINRINIRNLK